MSARIRGLLVLPVLWLAVPATAPAEETIWLRGRGSDVWIERSGDAQPSSEQPKAGLTQVASPVSALRAGMQDAAPADEASASPAAVVVLSAPWWSAGDPLYEHDYSPRYYYPPYSYRLHPDYRSFPLYPYGYSYPGYYGFQRGYPFARRHHDGLHPHHRHSRGHHGHSGGRGHPSFGGSGGPIGPAYGAGPHSGGHVVRGGAYRGVR